MAHEETAVTNAPVTEVDPRAARVSGRPSGSRLPSLTGLRFPAALMVFFYHSSLLIPSIAVFGYTALGARYSTIAANAGALGVSFFFVLSGKFIIDLEGRSVELLPNQGFVVPKGVMHCTRAPEKSVILMVETAAVVPTGDA